MSNMPVLTSGEYNRKDYKIVLAERERRERLFDRRRGALLNENEAARADVRRCAQERLQRKLDEYGILARTETPTDVDATAGLSIGAPPVTGVVLSHASTTYLPPKVKSGSEATGERMAHLLAWVSRIASR